MINLDNRYFPFESNRRHLVRSNIVRTDADHWDTRTGSDYLGVVGRQSFIGIQSISRLLSEDRLGTTNISWKSNNFA